MFTTVIGEINSAEDAGAGILQEAAAKGRDAQVMAKMQAAALLQDAKSEGQKEADAIIKYATAHAEEAKTKITLEYQHKADAIGELSKKNHSKAVALVVSSLRTEI